jgi:hypothetical protein
MEVSGLTSHPIYCTLQERALVSIEYEAGWVPQLSLDVLDKRKICPSQKSKP